MSKSYETINYSLRPAKCVERKFLLDTFRLLHPFCNIPEYRYIGFGSPYFSDFILFHRNMNISDMISIEKDDDNAERFNFNKPYDFIDLRFGKSSVVLPQLKYEKPTVIWLDYDGKLETYMLDDIDFICKHLVSGSFFVISMNADNLGREEQRSDIIKRNISFKYLPAGLRPADLTPLNLPGLYFRIMNNVINDAVTLRNAVLKDDEKLVYRQLIHFIYKDGALMLTLGGLLCKKAEQGLFEQCCFQQNQFLNITDKPYCIEIPCLTFKEIRKLDEKIKQDGTINIEEVPFLEKLDIAKYAKIYRYFPRYTEAEI